MRTPPLSYTPPNPTFAVPPAVNPVTSQAEELSDDREVYSADEGDSTFFSEEKDSTVFTSEPCDLAASTIFFSSQTPTVYSNEAAFKEDEKVTEELREKVNKLPKTSFFDPLKKSINHLVGGISLRKLKTRPDSYEENLKNLKSKYPKLKKKINDYCFELNIFFENKLLPIPSSLQNTQELFATMSGEYIQVKKWVEDQLKSLRRKIEKGTPPKPPLTKAQYAFVNYQLKRVLPKEIIENHIEASNTLYSFRENLLKTIEKDWDEVILSLQEMNDNIEICKIFTTHLKDSDVLTTFQAIQKETDQLDVAVSFLENKSLLSSVTRDLESFIGEKKKLEKSFSDFKRQKNSLYEIIKKILEDADAFIHPKPVKEHFGANLNSEFILINPEENHRFLPFLDLMAFPDSEESRLAKKMINDSAEGKVLKLSENLVTAWNEICLKSIEIEQKLLIINQIQDIYPQLADINTHVENECSALRTLRKTEENFNVADVKFQNHCSRFADFSKCIKSKNAYPYSRPNPLFQNKGLKFLYDIVVEEIESAVKNLNKILDKTSFPKYEIISYNDKTDKATCQNLNKVCQGRALLHQDILNKIKTRYDTLQGTNFTNFITELSRTNTVHTPVKANPAAYFKPVKQKVFKEEENREVEEDVKEKIVINGKEFEFIKLQPVGRTKLPGLYGYAFTSRATDPKFPSPFV